MRPNNQLGRARSSISNKELDLSIGVFSIFNIALSLASVVFQIFITMSNPNHFDTDFVGTGIWVGVFYFITGCLGLNCSKNDSSKRVFSFSTLVMSVVCVLLSGFAATTSFVYPYYYHRHQQSESNLKYLWGMKITLGAISVAAVLANVILMILTSVSTCCPFCCSCCCSMIRESEQENRTFVRELELLPSVLVCDGDAKSLSNSSQGNKIMCNNRKQSTSPPPPYCSNKSNQKKNNNTMIRIN